MDAAAAGVATILDLILPLLRIMRPSSFWDFLVTLWIYCYLSATRVMKHFDWREHWHEDYVIITGDLTLIGCWLECVCQVLYVLIIYDNNVVFCTSKDIFVLISNALFDKFAWADMCKCWNDFDLGMATKDWEGLQQMDLGDFITQLKKNYRSVENKSFFLDTAAIKQSKQNCN